MMANTTLPRIPDEEFSKRLANVKKKMEENSIDLMILYSNSLDPGHVRYLADVAGINESAAMVIPLNGEPTLCSGQACQIWSTHKSRVKDVRILPEVGEVAGTEYQVGDQYRFVDLFGEIRNKYQVKKIGTVGTLIFPHIIYKQLEQSFPDAKIVNAEPLMFELRVRKSKNEIACMRKAAEIVSDTFAELVKKIQVGWTELDIQAEIEAGVLRRGAEDTAVAWAPMIPSGPEHTKLCMNKNSLRKVQASEMICLQAGAMYEGYNAALCTPFVVGEIPMDIKRAVNIGNEVMNAVISNLKHGTTAKAVNAAGRAILEREGYAKYSPYALVHNIGCLECESPWMAADKEFPIVAGMTVCIDVFFFNLPWGSFRIEDTLAVTSDGAERLTTFNQKFISRYFS